MTKSWRDVLPIHPAADLFPLMSPEELKVLGEDIIKQMGLTSPIVWFKERGRWWLLDGRNRLDAMEAAGILEVSGKKVKLVLSEDCRILLQPGPDNTERKCLLSD